MKTVLRLMLLASIVFFVLGLMFPIIATKQQVFGVVLTYSEVKLFDSVRMFFDSSDYLLAGIILMFTIVFPILKFTELVNRSVNWIRISEKVSAVMNDLDKWSMLDVFLVALLLLNFKMNSDIVVMKLKIGTTFIGLSVILRMLYCSMNNKVENRELKMN